MTNSQSNWEIIKYIRIIKEKIKEKRNLQLFKNKN
jgi:hypothetical protein